MGNKTGISWTDATWNPVRGCSRVSEGCRHCYAERVAARFSGPGQPYAGLAVMRDPRPGEHGGRPAWTGDVSFVAEHLADPLKWRKPRRIFVNSMSDMFHEKLANEEIAAVFGVMAAAQRHTFQVLTKRARRMREWFAWLDGACMKLADFSAPWWRVLHCLAAAGNAMAADGDGAPLAGGAGATWPLPNVWIGVSVENQAAADERIPDLLRTPAEVRFLSCEPLIGEVDLDRPRCDDDHHGEAEWGLADDDATPWCNECDSERSYGHWLHLDGCIDWVIAGCESGPGARPCDVAWLRSLRDQCAAADVPFFLKQAREVDGAMTAVPPPTPLEDQPGYSPRVGPFIPTLGFGTGSKRKSGGVIELPFLDGVQHAHFPKGQP